MSEKVKLIIEIDKDRYNKIINNAKYACPTGLDSVIANGIPLEKVKAEIEQDGAYYQEIREKERASAYLEILSTIDKYMGKAECEG